MSTYRIIFLLFSLVCLRVSYAIDSKDILPPEQAFQLSITHATTDSVELAMHIEPAYHLYTEKFKFQSFTDSVQLGAIDIPEGKIEHDPAFGDVAVSRESFAIKVALLNPNHEKLFKLLVKYQGCADIGVCYPPQKILLDVSLSDPAPVAEPNPASVTNPLPAAVIPTQGLKSLVPSLFSQDLLSPEQAFQFNVTVKDAHTLHVSWLPATGYYLYKSKLSLSLDGSTTTSLKPFTLPSGETHEDPELGQVEIYHTEVSTDVALQRSSADAESLSLTAKFQGCADRWVCYPPQQTTVSINLPAISVQTEPAVDPVVEGSTPAATNVSEQDKIVQSLQQDGLGMTLLSFFGFFLLLAFTPCIFPMIPILSGIIVGQGEGISTRKAFLLSLSYVLASALMYTVFGVLAALFGSNLQAAFQEPWVIAAFSALFVLLSLSMFGFYELALPQALQAKVLKSSDQHRDGSYLGAAIMGALSSLIVGPCVAAPLAAALIFIGQTGDVILGGAALFVLALGMGSPLLLIGTSAGKLLPKSGAWLNNTKAVFGVVMLGVAVWMLSRILSDTLTMLLSAALLIISAVYLNALDPLSPTASGWKKFGKGLGVLLLVAGVLELVGVSAGSNQLLQPLSGLMAGNANGSAAKTALTFEIIHSVAELDAKLQLAAAQHKPVMLDFYAAWCVSCKEMEAYTFTDAKVQAQLAGYVRLQADVTENNADDKALLKKFSLIGPPGIIFYTANGLEKVGSRVIGFQDAATFLKTLQQL
jgi:thiol:disulfide interchange protein DsbD